MKADNGGLRYDNGKPPMHLLPWDALLELSHIYGKGAVKYAPHNWERGMNFSRVFDSLLRHAAAWNQGEDMDKESGQHHMLHVAWNALALFTYHLRQIGVDDRFKTVKLPTIKELLEALEVIDEVSDKPLTQAQVDYLLKPKTERKVGMAPELGMGFGEHADHADHPDHPDHPDTPNHGGFQHRSDCALHNGPAMMPEKCDCGADPTMTPERYGSEFPALDPQLVEIKVGLRFRLNIGDADIWEIIKDYGTGRFLARCDDHDKEPQMMTIRAIREIVTEHTKPASHRCYHCPDDAPAGELLCDKCKETPRL